MSARSLKTQRIDPTKAPICLQRAQELLETALEALDKERWSTVGVTAVHAAISLADALLIKKRQIVVFLGSRRQRFGEVEVIPLVEFLAELPTR